MSISDWFKKSIDNIKQVEGKLAKDGVSVVEIYHQNKLLEAEVRQRTVELNRVNQTLITLENVWDMMNSSKPLNSVLETIVQGLQTEFGYVYSCILEKRKDETGEWFAYRTFLHNEFTEYIDSYFATYPGIKHFLDSSVESAKASGMIRTMYGRIRQIPELSSSNFMQRSFGERIAMNSPIQGTAADIINKIGPAI